jgi:hypothetical protein
MTDQEEAMFGALIRLVSAVAPFSAKHKQDKCFCKDCNELRSALLMAAKVIEKIQPVTL